MKKILAIARKELLLFAQKPGTMILIFAVPLLFIWIVQAVFGSSGSPVITVFAVNEDGGRGGERVMAALRDAPNLSVDELETRDEADQRVGKGERMAAIIIPAGFTDAILYPEGAKIDIIIDPARAEQANIVIGLTHTALGPLVVEAEVSRAIDANFGQLASRLEPQTSGTETSQLTATPTPPVPTETPDLFLFSTATLDPQLNPLLGTPTLQPSFGPTSNPALSTPTIEVLVDPFLNTNTPTPESGSTEHTETPTPTLALTASLTPTAPGTAPSATPEETQAEATPTATATPSPLVKFLGAAMKGIVSSQVQQSLDNPQVLLDVSPVSGPQRKPSLLDYLVPGYSLMFVFFLVSNLASTMVEERQTGTLRRLLIAPIPRSQILLGKMLPYFAIAVVQLCLVLLVSSLLFGINLGNTPLALLIVIFAAAAVMAALGIMVAAFARSEGQAGGQATVIVIAMAVISGAMFPSIAIPGLQAITPHYWAMQGFINVIARGQGLDGAMGPAGILIVMAAVFFTIGAIRFRFE